MRPGEILRDSWELYRTHARHLISIAAIVYVPLGVVTALLVLAGWPGVILANLLNLAAIFLVQGALVKAVEDVRDGRRDVGVMQCFGFAGQRLVPLAIAGILAAAGILVGLALLIVPGLVLLTWWLVVSPVIVLESRSVLDGFGRSRALVRGSSWPVFGVVVMTMVIVFAFTLALGVVLQPLEETVRSFVVSVLGNSLAAPFAAVAWTLTYFRLRAIETARTPRVPVPVA
jgi:hypothetical protein